MEAIRRPFQCLLNQAKRRCHLLFRLGLLEPRKILVDFDCTDIKDLPFSLGYGVSAKFVYG